MRVYSEIRSASLSIALIRTHVACVLKWQPDGILKRELPSFQHRIFNVGQIGSGREVLTCAIGERHCYVLAVTSFLRVKVLFELQV